MSNIDPEDIIECKCYMILYIAEGKVWTDRVYKDRGYAEKRVEYLNKTLPSGALSHWFIVVSELNTRMGDE